MILAEAATLISVNQSCGNPRRASATAGPSSSGSGIPVPKRSRSRSYPATEEGISAESGPWMLWSPSTSGQVKKSFFSRPVSL